MNRRLFKAGQDFARSPRQKVLAWLKDGVMRTVIKNSGWLLGGTTIATLLGLLSTIVKTRDLGAEQFGLIAVILAYVAIIERLTSSMPWLALVKFGAEALQRKDPSEFMGHVKVAFSLDMIGALGGTLLAVIGANLFAQWQGLNPETTLLISVSAIAVLFNITGAAMGVLRILNHYRLFTIQQTIGASFGLLAAIVVYWGEWGISGYIIGTLIASILNRLTLLFFAMRVLHQQGYLKYWRSAKWGDWKPFVHFSKWTYFSSVLALPAKQLDVIIVSTFLSLEAAGIYKIVKQVAELLDRLGDPVYLAVYPQFAMLVANKNLEKAIKYGIKTGILILMVVAPIALGLAFTSQWWLGGIFGPSFTQAWFVMALFLAARTLIVPTLPIHPIFTVSGYVKQNTYILIVASIIYLALAFALTPLLGITGLIMAWLFEHILIVGYKAVYLLRDAVNSKQEKSRTAQ